MKHRVSRHALAEMTRRGIARRTVQQVLASPQQRVAEKHGRVCLQSKVNFPDGEFLVRVIVDVLTEPPTVVTAYRTSRIAKYWRQP